MAQLQRSPRDLARWQKAQRLLLGGQHGPALEGYQVLARLYPNIPELWFELGNAALGELDFTLANRAYQRARELAPNNASLLGLIGKQYQALRQLDDARSCYERALEVAADSVDAHINLAVWLEKERRLDEAFECVQSCLAKFPDDDQARYFHAFLLHRMKKDSEAESALRDLIKDRPRYPYVKYAAPHLLGVVLDQLGQYDQAFKWLADAKAQVRTIADTSVLERSYDAEALRRKELLEHLTPERIRRWRDESLAPTERHQFAFLGGHPRSGTTLMEQILDAHPDVLAFDEPVASGQEIFSRLDVSPSPDLDALPATRLADMRRAYGNSLLREARGASTARVLLDKNPSPTASLALLLRVFPELKVIIALRDPRDVAISCYFLNVALNATNVNFLSLERTAKHYSDLMGAWLRLREIGGFDWIETRYEDVVANLESEGRKVTAFLGLPWHDDQSRFFETARSKMLHAPTYHDVTQPIYSRAVGRWERYAAHLEPLKKTLEPYCRAFGY